MSRLIDISLPLHAGLPCWPGGPGLSLERVKSLEGGDDVNESRLCCGVHWGTHLDAPLHHLRDGASIDRLCLESLVGPAVVACLPGCAVISAGDLDLLDLPRGTERLLLHTDNSLLWRARAQSFDPGYVGLSEDAAEWAVARGIRLLGIDYLSIQPFGAGPAVHRILLGGGVIVLEGLNLDGVAAGDYELLCLPLNLVGADGAPARALLRSPAGAHQGARRS